ncbi:hypothetical protein ACN47E_002094 [Coniothyrium glycines]
MKYSSFALYLVSASLAKAQTSEPYYNETSAPFHLLITSEDGSINTTSGACHTGAALESLCLSDSNTTSKPNPIDGAVFYFNTSVYSQEPAPGLGKPGILTWILPGSNIGPIPSSVFFSYDPTTDITLPILQPGSDRSQSLAFDSDDKLTVQGYIDWTADPPSGANGVWKNYYRWFACKTYYSGYQYENLAWALGSDKPENPTCVAVNVTRSFI